MDHIKRHRAQIASQIFGSYGSVSVDDAIEKAIPVGTVNKYGKMKMPDGSWKYVGKGKTEGAQAKKDEALKHHVEEGKKMSADEVTAFIKKHGKAGTMPSDEELKKVSDAHKHLHEAERRSPKALKEAIKTSQEAYADDSKKKDVKETKLSDGSTATTFKVGDTKVTEIEDKESAEVSIPKDSEELATLIYGVGIHHDSDDWNKEFIHENYFPDNDMSVAEEAMKQYESLISDHKIDTHGSFDYKEAEDAAKEIKKIAKKKNAPNYLYDIGSLAGTDSIYIVSSDKPLNLGPNLREQKGFDKWAEGQYGSKYWND